MKNKTRVLAAGMALLMMVAAFTGCSSQKKTPLGTVGGKEISYDEFNYYVNAAISNVEQNLGSTYAELKDITVGDKTFDAFIKDSALQNCITNRYIELKFDELGLVFDSASEKEVDKMMEDLTAQYGGAMQFNESLRLLSTTKETFKKVGTLGYKQSQITEKLFGEGAEQEITEQQLKDYFDTEYAKVQHVLVSTQDAEGKALTEELKIAQKTLADSLLKDAQGGADFLELMKSHSSDKDQNGAPNNPEGYLFDKNANYMQEFKDLAFQLKQGEFGMTETSYGYHVMKKLDQNANPDDFAGVKADILITLQATKLDEVLKPMREATPPQTDQAAMDAFVIKRAEAKK